MTINGNSCETATACNGGRPREGGNARGVNAIHAATRARSGASCAHLVPHFMRVHNKHVPQEIHDGEEREHGDKNSHVEAAIDSVAEQHARCTPREAHSPPSRARCRRTHG